MGLMGTLAKVAIGYASARGTEHLSRNGGLGGLLGGAKIASSAASARSAAAGIPGVAEMQKMMGGASGGTGDALQQMMAAMGGAGAAGGMQDMMTKMMGSMGAMSSGGGNAMQDMMANLMTGAGGAATNPMQDMMASFLGGGGSSSGGGLLSGGNSGAGLAGLMALAGTAAAASGKGAGALFDAFNTRETVPEADEAAGLLLRAMIQAAKADGGIDEAEQAKILDLLGDDADAEDMAFIRAQLAAPVDITSLAQDTPAHQAMQVYAMSLMGIKVDTQAEAEYLDALAGALSLDQTTVNTLHLQMGVQPLYQ